ncbi:hypothetical protein OPW41_11945 [Vibrio europaeus]|uniref:hypothetical protein n=1 Tax=Vibrio europaeus TaxID=300876 RepID=UPI00233F2D19|nr:hypothetical protein [Vibrio europaeus]MDC5758322.1 hypothetical protein [Vibrio europaeus]MDC5776598.1 hypothetical protein [Vibrio europaeus]MDC5795543.1 hypothetical protein [Vibrio europaeus]MDC5801486.1 hypothetical protein [Vibrio europaeus]MDC5813236.1 hypothetical protein [Vibrio europaeus]
MRQVHTLEPHQTLSFNAGQAGKFLILRESTHTLMMRGDALRPTEIQRGDTIDVTKFDELTLENHHDDAATFEYQISDVPILTQAQKVDVSNAVVVHEVQRPVSVVEIQRAVRAQIQNELLNVHVDNETLSVTPSVTLYTYAAIDEGVFELDGTTQTIAGSSERKALFLQVPDDNTEPVLVQGFMVVNPGGHLPLNTNQAVTIKGKDGETVRVGEMR